MRLVQAEIDRAQDSTRLSELVMKKATALAARLTLSGREAEVLFHASMGLERKEIALLMGIQASTVKTHVENILGKAKVSKLKELVQRVLTGA